MLLPRGTHLARLFRREMQTTPMTHLWNVRTEHAVELTRSTGLTLSVVADHYGFSTQFHMSRRVKQLIQISPHQLRHISR